ncbi:MAG: citrate/2-methylcitrate synthase [Alphaproteobacteria bacterium]|jgi:citrate synthase|nr:citrate/2-methylcitrate synthase [Alphaproteobacteria bacterium]
MATRDMSDWETSIAAVVSGEDEEEVIVRGHRLSELIGKVGFAEMMFLMLQGHLPTKPQARVLDALLVASVEHGIAPPSMISRCFASYGTSIQAAVGGGILAFGDRMGGLGEQLAKTMVARLTAIDENVAEIGEDALAAEAETLVRETQAAGERVPGYGIPLHGTDPRAPQVLDIARTEGVHATYCRFAELIEAEIARQRGGRPVPMNLDGVGACVILDLGFAWQSTRLFLLTPRSVSMGAHYLEEQAQGTTWRHLPANRITYTDPT